jgi:PTS system nitrogen regulatory IIA component
MVADCPRAHCIWPIVMNTYAQYLLSENVFLNVRAANKWQAFALIAELLERSCQINRALVYEKLYERENMDTTGLGNGVAIPHAQVAGITQPVAAYVRLQTAIDFSAPDERPVSDLFIVLLPMKTTRDHLQILADIAALLCEPQSRARLIEAASVGEVLNCLQSPSLTA